MNFLKKLSIVGVSLALCAGGVSGATAAGLDDIDQTVRERLYNPKMLDPAQPVGASPLKDFVAKNPPPWKIGYASSYAGNTWRANAMAQLQNEIEYFERLRFRKHDIIKQKDNWIERTDDFQEREKRMLNTRAFPIRFHPNGFLFDFVCK